MLNLPAEDIRLISLSDAVRLALAGNIDVPRSVIHILKKSCSVRIIDIFINPNFNISFAILTVLINNNINISISSN